MVEQKHIKRRDDCGEQLLFPRPQVRVLCSSLFESVLQLAQRYDGEANGALAVCSEPVTDGPGVASQQINPNRRIERSEEHTSELQSRLHLVCRLLLEKKKMNLQRVHIL